MRMLPHDRRSLIAVDLGAESCRISLLRWKDESPQIQLIHRFANAPLQDASGHLRWPLDTIVDGVEYGIAKCAEYAPEGVRSIAVDGWSVDYVRIDEQGKPLDLPFCYRDDRAAKAETLLHAKIAPGRLRSITGLHLQSINTLYQQYADLLAGRPTGTKWLNLPEYLLHRWGAPPVAEYTNATHTEMVDQSERVWSDEILEVAGIDRATMPPLIPAGTKLGRLSRERFPQPAFAQTELIAPACHDTASAIAGIAPVDRGNWGYISSGTWSLVGTTLAGPCLSETAQSNGFTNLGGAAGAVLFHASVNGMWVLRQCMDAWAQSGAPSSITELVKAAQATPPPQQLLDLDDPELMRLGQMPARIRQQLHSRGYSCPERPAEIACLIFHSLADRYRRAFAEIEQYTGKKIQKVYVVGGGSQNEFLCRLTAEKIGLPVFRGAAESSTIGNLAVQLAALESEPNEPEFGNNISGWASFLSGPSEAVR